MKRTWDCSQVEVVHSILPVEELNQVLDWAEVIYGYFCQLHETSLGVPEFDAPIEQKRTGTDG
jgi:hypothetical protein